MYSLNSLESIPMIVRGILSEFDYSLDHWQSAMFKYEIYKTTANKNGFKFGSATMGTRTETLLLIGSFFSFCF
jgi:hypothetical protein